jgi:methylmalonyl-CoA epimerase
MTTLEHIGIAVSDPDAVLAMLRDLLGLRMYKSETVEREGVRTHFVGAGGVKLELLEALGPDSPVARFLEKRGEGVHHLAFEVEDVEVVIERGQAMGLSPLSPAVRPGADRKRIAFFHPKDTHGLLIEVCESIPQDTDDPMDDAAITAFGNSRSPAVVIACLDGSEEAELWLAVASQMESDRYSVVVQAEEARAQELLNGVLGPEDAMHLVVGPRGLGWARKYAALRGGGVLSVLAYEIDEFGVSVRAADPSRHEYVYRLPPVDRSSRRDVNMLAHLIGRIIEGP